MAVREKVGIVVSNKMQKTVVVAVENRTAHPKYGKIVVQTRRFKAHDEDNRCKIGDQVRISETRPLSKTKRWQVSEILREVTKL
ncbi:MAG: 30S ribosomal protein S17 [Cyanobacteriota bacterium]|nr:30S ribosomal protein S17 [Cyanobacteriota bacterium]